jgi:imidazolonepropionase-like amidohydrolase
MSATAASMPARDLAMDTLRGVLDGEILVQNHCYRADEMANIIDMAKEFGYKVAAFHHAVEATRSPTCCARTASARAMWADWWGFKMEAYDGINENIPLVHNAGACAIVHSDDPNGIQRLNQEAAKALAYGRRAWASRSRRGRLDLAQLNPAKALGIADRTGSLARQDGGRGAVERQSLQRLHPARAGLDRRRADVRRTIRAARPVTDFELGQPGEGDVK